MRPEYDILVNITHPHGIGTERKLLDKEENMEAVPTLTP
jgi:hypothetical protein